jgi:hypothetical protein
MYLLLLEQAGEKHFCPLTFYSWTSCLKDENVKNVQNITLELALIPLL